MDGSALDQLCVNTLRALSVDAIEKADSGHPGLPLGAAPMAFVLWHRHLRYDPSAPAWPDRDRFVLSAGHGSALLYSLLHLAGYDLTLDDLRAFRQWGSRTPGHPEYGCAPGVEATTGPLGQGAANAVGMAIAERALAHHFNRAGYEIVNHRTWALVSDGDLMEGVTAEASSLAGHLRLGKLVFLYDSNGVSLDGPTSLTFTEDVARRYESYGWHVLRVAEGNTDLTAIDRALVDVRARPERPSLVIVETTLGYGSPGKQGTAAAHGSPLGPEETRRTKQAIGWDPDLSFHVPAEAAEHFRRRGREGREENAAWARRVDAYRRAYPDLAEEWRRVTAGELPAGWDRNLPAWDAGESVATRKASGIVLNALARRLLEILGGDADLSSSTRTAIQGAGDFDGRTGAGRNLHFGVREHAMGGVVNGLAYHGGVRPYASTFFVFSDYMRPAVRMAALSGLAVTYIWTHDSIAVGEDGPTHQPVEQLASLRALPNLVLFRPCDANETVEAWRYAMERRDGPTALVLSRQDLPVLDRRRFAPASGTTRGAYVLSDTPGGDPRVILIASGSEVHPTLEARDLLEAEGIRTRVVSMPSWEVFEAEDEAYRERVLPSAVRARVAVEALATFGWERWVGARGVILGVDRFGSSGPGDGNLRRYGFTPDRIAAAAQRAIERDNE